MGIQYHIGALRQDIDYGDAINGAANLAAVKGALERRKSQGYSDPELESAVEDLALYFGGGAAGLTDEERELSRRQNEEGELLSEAEGARLESAQRRVAKAAGLTKAEAKKRAKLIKQLARDWTE